MNLVVRLAPKTALTKRRIEATKEQLDVPTVASDFAQERGGEIQKKGERWRGVCPVCGHGSNSDAFSCQVDLWTCHACGSGGDVVKLAQLAGPFDSAGEAVGYLEFRYGLDLPKRPDSWYSKQSRQARIRQELVEKRAMVFRRRLFRIIMVPLLRSTAATDEEIKAAWADFQELHVEDLMEKCG